MILSFDTGSKQNTSKLITECKVNPEPFTVINWISSSSSNSSPSQLDKPSSASSILGKNKLLVEALLMP